MDSQANQSFSDDQELAKVLAGVSQDTDNNLQFEETNATASPVINPATISPDPIAWSVRSLLKDKQTFLQKKSLTLIYYFFVLRTTKL